MDIVYAAEKATAAEVLKSMSDPPSYSTVRKLLTILVEKGQLKFRNSGNKYVYRPTKPRSKAGRSAMKRVLDTFYEGSLEKAVASLISGRDARLSQDELDRLSQLIRDAQDEGV